MCVTFFLQLQSQLRVLHWQTKSYAEHKALGKAYEGLDGLVDQFVEIHSSKYGNTFATPNFNFTVNNYTNSNSLGVIQNAIYYLTHELPEKLDSKQDTDLLNIRDEMLGVLNQTKYLLRLQ